jgi:acyl-CoA thioester hydrolase
MFDECKTSLELRIDWADLDLFGHVNNVAFFRYIQAARVNYCDLIGLSSLNQTPLSFMVASTQCQFKAPITFPGKVMIYTKVDWIRNTSFQLIHKIVGQRSEACAEGTDVLVVYDHHNKEKAKISEDLEALISKVEGRKFR